MSRQRMLVIAAAILALLAATDFLRRIHVPRQHESRDAGSFQPVAVRAPLPPARISQDLVKWLPKLRPLAPGAGAGGEEQWALTLFAVFDDRNAPFAVIQAKPAAGGAARLERVVEGDEFHGFRVSRIEPLRVTLASERGEQSLSLFKPAEAAVAGVGTAPAAPAEAPMPARSQPSAKPADDEAPVAGARKVETKELKPGAAFELPASMRGMKVVEPTLPPQTPTAQATDAGPNQPQKP